MGGARPGVGRLCQVALQPLRAPVLVQVQVGRHGAEIAARIADGLGARRRALGQAHPGVVRHFARLLVAAEAAAQEAHEGFVVQREFMQEVRRGHSREG
jgi:hypothetical protein